MENHTHFENSSSEFSFKVQIHLDVVRLAILVPVALFSAVANLSIVYFVSCGKCNRSVSNYFYASMAVADFCSGMINYSFGILLGFGAGRFLLGPVICVFWCISDGTFGTISLYHLLAIAIDRLRSIVSPFHLKPTSVRKREVIAASISIWLCSFALWSAYYLGINYEGILCGSAISKILVFPTVFILCVVPLFGVLSLNVAIYAKIKARKTISSSSQTVCSACFVGCSNLDDAFKDKREKKREMRNKKMAFVLAISTLAFLICWLPWIIVWVASDMFNLVVSKQLHEVFDGLYSVHATLQPLLLFMFHANFRVALRKIFFKSRNKESDATTVAE